MSKIPSVGSIIKIKGRDCVIVDFHGMRVALSVDKLKQLHKKQ